MPGPVAGRCGGRAPSFLLMGPLLLAGAVGVTACSGGGANGEASAGGMTTTQEPEAAERGGESPSIVGRAPGASGGVPAVVTLRPADDGATAREATADSEASAGAEPAPTTAGAGGSFPEPVVDQLGLAFLPGALVVQVGRPVTFTNSEGSLVHNVHVRSIAGDSTIFNADAAPGDEVVVALPEEGGYDVLCDMHPGMTAFIYATGAPWATVAEPDGRFRFTGVPAGRYLLRVWTVDGGPGEERETRVEEGVTREVDLEPPR